MLGKANGIEFNIVMKQGGKGVMDGLYAGDLDIGLAPAFRPALFLPATW